MLKFVLAVAVALTACGPSTAQIKTAKTARYSATPAELFNLARAVVERDYKVAEADPESLTIITEGQAYGRDGGRRSAGAGDYVQLSGGDIILSMQVEVLEAEGTHVIVVTPNVLEVVAGSPKPRPIEPKDPNMPGWIEGRVDTLSVAIYDAAKPHVAK